MPSTEKARLLNPLDWAQAVLTAPDDDSLEGWLAVRTAALGCETVALCTDVSRRNPVIPARDRIFGSLVNPDWHDFYHRNTHLMPHDPMAKYIFSSEVPGVWLADRPSRIQVREPGERKFMDRLLDFGMWGSLGFCIFDRQSGTANVFVAATFYENREFAHTSLNFAGQLQLACEYFLEAMRMRRHGTGNAPATLSPRERECLLWAAVGKTTKEIADRLSLTDYTVDSYIASAMCKLGCSTRAQACMNAILIDQIAP
ncbi:MAG: hypothetical protein Kow0026_00230 [Oricola sp.]